MTTFDSQRIALRPILDLPAATKVEEQFQNNTLRPIMKQQNDLLQAALEIFLVKRKVKLEQVPASQRFDKIKELVTRDNQLRGLLIGMAAGQFTSEEMAYYVANDRDVNRRMTNLLVERLS
jgi:hypothetical protein